MSPDLSRSPTGRVFEMSGSPPTPAHIQLCHLLVVPQTKSGLPRRRSSSLSVRELKSRRASRPSRTRADSGVDTAFEPIGATREPRRFVAGRLCRPDFFAPAQTGRGRADHLRNQYRGHVAGDVSSRRMARWRDCAVAASWFGGTETYFYQNNPMILDSTGATMRAKSTSSAPLPRSRAQTTSTG